MSQVIVLQLGKGNWQQGFPLVTAQVWELGSVAPTQFAGSLPAAPRLPILYKQWQSLYKALYQRRKQYQSVETRGIEIDTSAITNVSVFEFEGICETLKFQLNSWLDSNSFREIEKQLRTKLFPSEEIRVVIETEDPELRQFPWQLWKFLDDYPHAEVSLATSEHSRVQGKSQKTARSVKILAILGDSKGIEVHQDRAFLQEVPEAATVFLAEPPRYELNNWLWEEKGWDILYFAGHIDGEKGEIRLNSTENLTIAQLKHALKAAIARGLKIAIFNGCDGLVLARAMADLNIPQLVVMREPVPDVVAQEFLKSLLAAYSSGRSLYCSVREARERLQGLESQFPCASWLPVICQNPVEVPPTWEELRDGISLKPEKPSEVFLKSEKPKWRDKLQMLFLGSVVALATIVGIRQLGLLQTWELGSYDQLVRSRLKTEAPDPRLLIITVTQSDVQSQPDRQGASLSNRSLARLLEKLEPYQPALVGLDLYRDYPIEPEYRQLAERFQQNKPSLIAVCSAGATDDDPGIPPPPDIPKNQVLERIGFSDIPPEPDGKTIRRQLFGQVPPEQSACQSKRSLSFLVAYQYLKQRDPNLQVQWNSTNVQIGSVIFPVVEADIGGYHQVDDGGYQVLLNYRSAKQVATQLTFAEALDGKTMTPELVKGKIVLIGTVDPSYGDMHLTPFGQGELGEMPGVLIQAHMISQILSAVQDGRSLIWWLPEWGEIIWVWCWALVSAGIAIFWRSGWMIWLLEGVAIVVLYGCCYLFFLKGGWMPFVPSALGGIVSVGMIQMYVQVQDKVLS
jgi:CHASE2 domain-containing sensor protein